MNSPVLILTVLLISLSFCIASAVLAVKKKKASDCFWYASWLCEISLVINNYLLNGYAPFVSMFQVLIFLSVMFIPAYYFVFFRTRSSEHKPLFIIANAIVSAAPVFMEKNAVWAFPPALRSPWFVPHILVYMVAYSLAAVVFLITIINLIKKVKNDNSAYFCVRLLFPFMTCGMFFGAVWANQVWGEFWSFDIKECWSLISWLLYMLYLHCYRKEKLRSICPLLAILGFFAVIITFLFANVIGGDSVHSYN